MDKNEINSILQTLKSNSESNTKKANVLEKLIENFRRNRIYASFFAQENPVQTYAELMNLYFSSIGASKDFINLILTALDMILANVMCKKEIFTLIYQSLSYYYFNQEQFSEEILYHYVFLLGRFYQNYKGTKSIKLPNNYFYFLNKSSMRISNKPPVMDLFNGFTILMWFRLSVDHKKGSLISFKSAGQEISIVYDNSSKKLFAEEKGEIINMNIPVKTDEYTFFYLRVNKNMLHLMLNNQDTSVKNCIDNFDEFTIFENCVGEVSSVIILNKLEDLEFEKINSALPFGVYKISKLPNLLEIIQLDDILSLYTPSNFKTLNKETNSTVVDDYLSANDAELVGDAYSHIYTNYSKKIPEVGGVKNILPIFEIIHTCTENGVFKLTQNFLNHFFDLMLIIIANSQINRQDIIDSKFLHVASLFIEKYPDNFFNQSLVKKMLDTAKILQTLDGDLFKVFLETILLNERICFKFDTESKSAIWKAFGEDFFSKLETIFTYMPMDKICLFLKYYDETKYSEFCCNFHKNCFIERENTGKKVMNPPLKEQTNTLTTVLENILTQQDASKAEEPKILFEFLCLNLSPCMSNIIINFLIGMLNNKDLFLKLRAKNIVENPNFEDIILNLYIRSIPDIRYQILYLVALSLKTQSFSDEFIQSLEDNISLSSLFFTDQIDPATYATTIKDLAAHCVQKLKTNDEDKTKCQQFGKLKCIFKEEYLEESFLPTYNCLLQILLKKPLQTLEDCKKDYILSSTDNIQYENTLNTLIKYVQYFPGIKREEKEIKLLQDMDTLFSKNVKNSYAVYSNKTLYLYLLKNIYNSYENPQYKQKFELSKKVLLGIYTGTLFLDNTINGVLQGYPTMMLNVMLTYFSKLKHNQPKEVVDKVQKITLLIFSDYLSVLEKNINSTKTTITYESTYYQNLNTLFSIILEYNLTKNKNIIYFEEACISHMNSGGNYYVSKSIPHFFLCNINEEEGAQDYFSDEFALLERIIQCLSPMWDPAKIMKSVKNHTNAQFNPDELVEYFEDIIDSLLYEEKTKSILIDELKYFHNVFLSNYNWELVQCIIIYYSITLYRFASKGETEEISEIMKNKANQFKEFMIFFIICSLNYFEGGKGLSDNLHQDYLNQMALIVIYYLSFVNEQSHLYNVSENFRRILKSCFTEVSALTLLVCYKITQNKEKKFGFSGIFSRGGVKRKKLAECGIYTLISSLGPSLIENEFIKRHKSKQFKNIYEDFNIEPVHSSIFDNEDTLAKLLNYFKLEAIKTRITEKRNTYSSLGQRKDAAQLTSKRSQNIYKLINKYQISISKFSNSSFMVIKEKRNTYKRIKKQIFLFKGMWSNDEDLYQNKLKLKILNHYTKSLSKPLLIPILDINYYVPNFSDFQTQRMFKEKSEHNVNLDIDLLLKGTNQNEADKILSLTDRNFLYYIDSNTDKHSFELNYNLLLTKEEDFIIFFDSIRKFSKNEALKKNENSYFSCFVKPSHHIKGIFYINEDYISFNVFINQIKGNNIVESSDTIEDVKSLENFQNFDEDRGTCFGSYFRYHHKDKDALVFKIYFDDLTYVFRRRYYQSNDAIEFFTKNHKSYYFVFKTQMDRENCLKDIMAHLNLSDNVKTITVDTQNSKDPFSNVIGYETSKRTFFDTKKKKVSSLLKNWQDLKISNFEFLMWLNLYANRSFSDLSQYPVFPWIIKNYESEKLNLVPDDYRDLSIPMGLMELSDRGEARKEGYIQNYETLKENAEEFEEQVEEEGDMGPPKVIPYFFGSHYSNPIYVAHYLTRIFPYSHISIELQGNKFDQPDRLFLEIKNSFVCATEGKCDLREVIGEFYYLPEMFLNMNHLNLGQKENGEWIENVLCPAWSENNAFKFITKSRIALESDYASQNIGKWIDLIFGSKQRGKEGLKACNLYYPECYEIDVDSMQDPEAKKVKLRMVEFGCTPKQLFSSDIIAKKKEPNKKKLCDEILNWKTKQLFIKLPKNIEEMEKSKEPILYWYKVFEEDERILTLDRKSEDVNLIKILKENEKVAPAALQHSKTTMGFENPIAAAPTSEESSKKYFIGKSQYYYGVTHSQRSPPIVMYYDKENKDRLTVIQGGFYYSKLVITNIEVSLFKEMKANNVESNLRTNYLTLFIGNEPFVITSLALLESKIVEKDKVQLTLLIGNEIGNITIATITDILKEPKVEIERKLINNSLPITDIAISFDMNLFGSCSEDGYVNLYTFTTLKLFRSIFVEDFVCDYIFISTCPLNSIVVINQSLNKVKTYSINGEFLAESEDSTQQYIMKSPKVVRDSNFCEYLIYIFGVKLIMRRLPYLEMKQECTIPIRNPEMIDINEGEKTMYIINGNGDEVVYLKNYNLDKASI